MKEKGITLIALIITIIILLILAGVTINVLIGENGLFKITKEAGEKYEQARAREKLEAVLIELQADKITKLEYNEKDYIDNKLKENNMQVEGDVVTVDGWQFEIDRSVPQIAQDLVKETEFEKLTRGKAKFIYNREIGYVGSVEVSIEIDERIKTNKVQYKIGEGENATWIDYIEGTTFNVTDNVTVYGRIVSNETNEIGYSFEIEISNVDKVLPKDAQIEFDKTKVSVEETIQATVTQYDDETGIDITNCKYIVNTSKDEIGAEQIVWNNATKFSSNPQTIDIKQSTAGNYYLHILSIDVANNLLETVSEVINFKGIEYYLNAVNNDRYGQNFTADWELYGEHYDNGFSYGVDKGRMFYATYKKLVDVTDIETINFYNYGTYTAESTVKYRLRLVDEPRANTAVVEIEGSTSNLGNSAQTVNLSLDVSEITR